MNLAFAALLASLGVAEPLHATTLDGPHPTLDAACAAALTASGAPARPCVSTPIQPSGAPFSIALLRSADTSDPRFAGSGIFFLAIRSEGAWFVAPKPIDRVNGAAGHTYLPVITPSAARTITSTSGAPRVLLRFVDATSRVCNVCEGLPRARRARELVQTQAMVLVCGRDAENQPACTAPIAIDAKARTMLAPDGTLAITAPGAAAKQYDVIF